MNNDNNSTMKKICKKIFQIVLLVLKPFIPYIALFLFIFFFIILIIDAIFVEFSNKDGEIKYSEEEFEDYCESVCASNYDVYVDGEKTSDNVEVDSSELGKSITGEQIYSLMIFHNITEDTPITKNQINKIANNFKSQYYYKTSTILTEKKIVDEEGNVSWEKVSEQSVKLITDSITFLGHYKFDYVEEINEERRYTNYKRSFENYNISRRRI